MNEEFSAAAAVPFAPTDREWRRCTPGRRLRSLGAARHPLDRAWRELGDLRAATLVHRFRDRCVVSWCLMTDPSPNGLERVLSDELKSLLVITVVDELRDLYARVDWIHWDSGFRGVGLEIGDRIVAVNGAPLALPDEPAARRVARDRLIGGLTESLAFAELGLQDGSPLTVSVLRRNMPGRGWISHQITGTVRAERAYYTAEGKRALAPGGPEGIGRNDVGDTWGSWLERRVFEWSSFLDGERLRTFDSRRELARHLEIRPRIDFALKEHPGVFAKRLAEDWERVAVSLRGREVQLSPDALAFRAAGEELQREIAAAGDEAWTAFIDAHQAVETLPAVDLVRDDRGPLAGKVIARTDVTWRDSVKDGDRVIFVSEHSGYFCYIRADQPAMRALWEQQADYQARVAPSLPETYDIIGRISGGTRLVITPRTGAKIGLDVDVLAGRVPGHFFADLTGDARFAGAERAALRSAGPPPDVASPSEVMLAYVETVKTGDDKAWLALYADWLAMGGEGPPLYRPYNPYRNHLVDFTRAREFILKTVVDVEPIWEGDQIMVINGDEFGGAPKIEQVNVLVDHIGEFDGGYHAFTTSDLSRLWRLQRRDGGPWRIASRNVL